MNPVTGHDDSGNPTWFFPEKFRTRDLHNVMAIAVTGDFEGHVSIGPMCPVERADSPCPNQPVQAVVTALKRVGEAAGSVRTSDTGAYFLRLDPGTYLVYAHEVGDNPPLSKLERVTVGTNQVIKLDLVIDSGIR